MKELKVVVAGTIEAISGQKIQMNNRGIGLEFSMVSEEISNITIGQEVEVTLVISCDDQDFSRLRGYIRKDAYDFVMQFASVLGCGWGRADRMCHYLRSKGMSRKDICFEISRGNVSLIVEASGLVPRTAQRLILELANKVDTFETVDASEESTEKYAEVIKELESLGFIKKDILKTLSEISIDDEMQPIDIIQLVIQKMQ